MYSTVELKMNLKLDVHQQYENAGSGSPLFSPLGPILVTFFLATPLLFHWLQIQSWLPFFLLPPSLLLSHPLWVQSWLPFFLPPRCSSTGCRSNPGYLFLATSCYSPTGCRSNPGYFFIIKITFFTYLYHLFYIFTYLFYIFAYLFHNLNHLLIFLPTYLQPNKKQDFKANEAKKGKEILTHSGNQP